MNKIKVEVCYASKDQQRLIALDVDSASSILEVIEQSRIKMVFPEINLAKNKVGIFGKVVKNPGQTIVCSGDRIEIYRPLIKSK